MMASVNHASIGRFAKLFSSGQVEAFGVAYIPQHGVYQGVSPLRVALENNHDAAAIALLECGATLERFCVELIAAHGSIDLLRAIMPLVDVNAPLNAGHTVLTAACFEGQRVMDARITAVTLVLESGGDRCTLLTHMARRVRAEVDRDQWFDHPRSVELMRVMLPKEAALHMAALGNNAAAVEAALGCDVAVAGASPVELAIAFEKWVPLEALLRGGASVEGALMVSISSNARYCATVLATRAFGWNEKTEALVVAVQANRIDHVDVLLSAGADPNALDSTGVPLLVAAARFEYDYDDIENVECARRLLAAGADPSAGSPLLEAVKAFNFDIAEDLLSSGADIVVPALLEELLKLRGSSFPPEDAAARSMLSLCHSEAQARANKKERAAEALRAAGENLSRHAGSEELCALRAVDGARGEGCDDYHAELRFQWFLENPLESEPGPPPGWKPSDKKAAAKLAKGWLALCWERTAQAAAEYSDARAEAQKSASRAFSKEDVEAMKLELDNWPHVMQ